VIRGDSPLQVANIKRQNEMIERVSKRYGMEAATSSFEYAPLDGILTKNGIIKTVFEAKCREMSLAKLRAYGNYIITEEKMRQGVATGKALGVGFSIIIGLEDADCILKVSNHYGDILPHVEYRETLTFKDSKKVERILRNNAYIDVRDMEVNLL
jgi:hypothetical protein